MTAAIDNDSSTLDPASQITTTTEGIEMMITQSLVSINAGGQVEPLLATSWTAGQGGLSYTFTLRRGVEFSDGEPFDAQAVKFSIDRLLDPNTFESQPGVLTVIKDVVVVDTYHVTFDLDHPYAPFVREMSASVAAILAPESVDRAPNTSASVKDPIGTGPYVLKQHIYGQSTTVVANPRYWGRKPAFKTQVFKIVPDPASREAAMRAGQVDVALAPPPNDLPNLRKESNVDVLTYPDSRIIFIGIDTKDPRVPALANESVRQAMNYAVNKQAIIKNVLFGAGQEMSAPTSNILPGYCKTGPYPYNPGKAEALLRAAGAKGLTITLGSPEGRYPGDYQVTQAVAGYLRAVGMSVKLPNPPDWPTYLNSLLDPPATVPYSASLLGWSSTDISDQLELYQAAYLPPHGYDFAWYEDSKVDQLISQANADLNATNRDHEYCRALKQIWTAAPSIFLYQNEFPVLERKGLKGIYMLPGEVVLTTYARS